MFSIETKQAVTEAQHGYCRADGCLNPIHSIHHKLHDTAYNRKRFPLFIDSPMNGVGLCFFHHNDKQHLWRVTDKEAEAYEKFLQELKG